jgi:hypothetical protein
MILALCSLSKGIESRSAEVAQTSECFRLWLFRAETVEPTDQEDFFEERVALRLVS